MQNLSNIQHRTWVVPRNLLRPSSTQLKSYSARFDPGLTGGIKDLLYNTLVNLHTGEKKKCFTG